MTDTEKEMHDRAVKIQKIYYIIWQEKRGLLINALE